MPYSSFTLAKAKKEFGLTTAEGGRFLRRLTQLRRVRGCKRRWKICRGL